MIKLIVSDLDGTLLRPKAQQLDAATLELIDKLLKKGFLIAIASGRQYGNIRRMFGVLSDRLIYICENGSILIQDGHVESKAVITQELCEKMIGRFIYEDAEVLFSTVDKSYIAPKSEYFYNLIVNRMKNDTEVVTTLQHLNVECVKMSFYRQEGVDDKLLFEWKTTYGTDVDVIRSSEKWVELMPKGVNKGVTLNKYMKKNGILPSECMIFGDQENDMEMMKLSEHAYAMKHGNPKLAVAARKSITHPEEILRILLENK